MVHGEGGTVNEAVCEICGIRFIKNSNSHKYCGDECARIAEREKSYQRKMKYRYRWGMHDKSEVGTGYLYGKRDADFEKEQKLVQKELKRCGLI